MAVLYSILDSQHSDKKALLVYTDRGPVHRVTYVSVQVSLIALFLKLVLDFSPQLAQHHVIPGETQWSESCPPSTLSYNVS